MQIYMLYSLVQNEYILGLYEYYKGIVQLQYEFSINMHPELAPCNMT